MDEEGFREWGADPLKVVGLIRPGPELWLKKGRRNITVGPR